MVNQGGIFPERLQLVKVKGYTLIEVIIAIAILAILSAGMGKYLASRKSSVDLLLDMQSIEVSKYILHQRKLANDWMSGEAQIRFANREWQIRVQTLSANSSMNNQTESCIEVRSKAAISQEWGEAVVGCNHE